VSQDPFEVLGLSRTASIADIRAARKRLALEHHPDVGGDDRSMQAVNEAFEAAVAHATGRRPLPSAPTRSATSTTTGPTTATASRPERSRRPPPAQGFRRAQVDEWSFVIESLPAEAFEALVVVAGWMGEVLVDDPPYLLDVHLYEPSECWCRLTLVPDAGSSTVSLVVAPAGTGLAPDVEIVRDLWVAQLNSLGRWDPDA
jgi:hypothetical protein